MKGTHKNGTLLTFLSLLEFHFSCQHNSAIFCHREQFFSVVGDAVLDNLCFVGWSIGVTSSAQSQKRGICGKIQRDDRSHRESFSRSDVRKHGARAN